MQFTLYNDEFITMEQVIQKRITEYGNINKKKNTWKGQLPLTDVGFVAAL